MAQWRLTKHLHFLKQFTRVSVRNYSVLLFINTFKMGISGPSEASPAQLKTIIIEINREISNQSFKIVATNCEISNSKVLVWVNTRCDEISRLQLGLLDVEKEYFHVLMLEILSSEEHSILYPRAINISSTLNGSLSRVNGEKAFMKWIREGYFVKVEQFIYFGVRLVQEFTTFLRTNTVNCICGLCSELVFNGKTCSSCEKPFHVVCIDKYLVNQRTCPSCKNQWNARRKSSNMETNDSF